MTTQAPPRESKQMDLDPSPGTLASENMSLDTDVQSFPAVVTEHGEITLFRVWRTDTGEKEDMLTDMWPFVKDLLLSDGRPAFSTEDPGIENPTVGKYRCRLHEDDEERAVWDSMGFKVCNKEGLSSPYAVKLHMSGYHTRYLQSIEAYEADQKHEEFKKEHQEDREVQREFLKVMSQVAVTTRGVEGHDHSYGKGANPGDPCTVEGCDHTKPY